MFYLSSLHIQHHFTSNHGIERWQQIFVLLEKPAETLKSRHQSQKICPSAPRATNSSLHFFCIQQPVFRRSLFSLQDLSCPSLNSSITSAETKKQMSVRVSHPVQANYKTDVLTAKRVLAPIQRPVSQICQQSIGHKLNVLRH